MHAHTVVRTALRAPFGAVGVSSFCLLASMAALALAALPILFVPFGIDTAARGETLPWPITVGPLREGVFAVSGALLLATAWIVARMGPRFCPLEPELARQYRRLRHWNRWMLRISAILWLAAIIGAYIAPPVRAVLA